MLRVARGRRAILPLPAPTAIAAIQMVRPGFESGSFLKKEPKNFFNMALGLL
jgi:hypothetical protein